MKIKLAETEEQYIVIIKTLQRARDRVGGVIGAGVGMPVRKRVGVYKIYDRLHDLLDQAVAEKSKLSSASRRK